MGAAHTQTFLDLDSNLGEIGIKGVHSMLVNNIGSDILTELFRFAYLLQNTPVFWGCLLALQFYWSRTSYWLYVSHSVRLLLCAADWTVFVYTYVPCISLGHYPSEIEVQLSHCSSMEYFELLTSIRFLFVARVYRRGRQHSL